jgi:hypothetical protein
MCKMVIYMCFVINPLTLNLLTTTIVAPHSNARIWQIGFHSAFKGLNNVSSLFERSLILVIL